MVGQTSEEGLVLGCVWRRGLTSDVRVSYVLQNIEHVLWNWSTVTVQSFCILRQEEGVKGGQVWWWRKRERERERGRKRGRKREGERGRGGGGTKPILSRKLLQLTDCPALGSFTVLCQYAESVTSFPPSPTV
jgi:hypothetical protein